MVCIIFIMPSQRLTSNFRKNTNYHLVKIGKSDRWKVISACGRDVPHDELLLVTNQTYQGVIAVDDIQELPPRAHPSRTILLTSPPILHPYGPLDPFSRHTTLSVTVKNKTSVGMRQ